MRLIDADALKHTLCELERRAGFGTVKDSLDGFKLLIDKAPTVELVHPCHHRYKLYGAFDVLHHKPTEEEQLEIKRSLGEKLLPALIDELQVCRCHYPAGERLAEDPLESWTYGVKFTVCHQCGKRDIECEDKSFHEHGITAMKKELGIAIAEPYIGEPGEALKL